MPHRQTATAAAVHSTRGMIVCLIGANLGLPITNEHCNIPCISTSRMQAADPYPKELASKKT